MKFDKWIVCSVIILALLALPLILFIAVNKGYIAEIKLPFISVPKLIDGRMNEVSFNNMLNKIRNLFGVISKQSDGLYWNSTEEFGLYYKGTLLFSVLGWMITLKECLKSIQAKVLSGYVFLMIQFITAFVLGMLVSANINRINCIHISIVVFTVIGLTKIAKLLEPELPYINMLFICCFLVLFAKFEHFYYTEYNEKISIIFQSGIKESVEFAMELSNENTPIYVSGIKYPKILFYSKLPVKEYIDTVEYTNYPSKFLKVLHCGNFNFDVLPEGEDGIYIVVLNGEEQKYFDMGYDVKSYGTVGVVYRT